MFQKWQNLILTFKLKIIIKKKYYKWKNSLIKSLDEKIHPKSNDAHDWDCLLVPEKRVLSILHQIHRSTQPIRILEY